MKKQMLFHGIVSRDMAFLNVEDCVLRMLPQSFGLLPSGALLTDAPGFVAELVDPLYGIRVLRTEGDGAEGHRTRAGKAAALAAPSPRVHWSLSSDSVSKDQLLLSAHSWHVSLLEMENGALSELGNGSHLV